MLRGVDDGGAESSGAIAPRRRIASRGRPLEDPGCAGCRQLALLRALRRAGLAVEGGLGCEAPHPTGHEVPHGRVARMVGAVEALVRPGALVAESRGLALLAVADRGPHRAAAVETALAAAGARVVRLPAEPTPDHAERVVADALARGPVALVALVQCARGDEARPPSSIDAARCNRCGQCLGLGCVAISDPGGDALVIDGVVCVGCDRCAPLCRARAITRSGG